MNLRRIFRRTRPTPPPAPTVHPHDLIVMGVCGITPELWQTLDPTSRAWFRTNYLKVGNK